MSDSGAYFRFRRNAKIGEAAAEEDDDFLLQSFHDVGDFAELKNTRSPRRIVVGRTGSGKTALLRYLQHVEEHVVEVDPENLSLNFISNNEIIRFFESAGVKLDLFYGLLWKHVLTVELLQVRYGLKTEEKTRSWLESMVDNFRRKDQAKERAINYLRDWGSKFWVETETRVKELTTRMASELSVSAGVKLDVLQTGAKGVASLSEEAKQEVISRGQAIVNKVQLRELSDVLHFLNDDVFTDPQRPFYISIDKLDENWIEDGLRYRLIRALIETVRDFRRVQNVKIVVALRQDLLRKVFSVTADGGFQEEKYEALFLRLRWSKRQIESLIDKRLAILVRKQYTNRSLGLRELFPDKVGKLDFLDYFVQRTAMRPRDAILFVNDCISRSEDTYKVKIQTIYEAERDYSRLRRESLEYEWMRLYPSLKLAMTLIERQPAEFRLSMLEASAVDQFISDASDLIERDAVVEASKLYMESTSGSKNAVLAEVFRMLFDVGAVGLRLEGGTGVLWNQESTVPSLGQIKPSTKALVHPMFHQSLHTQFV